MRKVGRRMDFTTFTVSSVVRYLQKWWLNLRASLALLIKRDDLAVDLYRTILRIDPNDEFAHAVLGNLYAKRGDRTAAINEFEQLVARHPKNADGWFNLGFIYDQSDDLADAERCFRMALELNPALDRACYGLGLVLIRQNRLDEAIVALKRNIKLQHFSPYGYYQLGMTYHHLGRSTEAWQMYEKLSQFEPKYAATLKRDLEQTVPQAAGEHKPSQSTQETRAEAV